MVEVPGDEEEEVLTDESQSSKGIVSSVVGHVSLSKRISSSIKKVMLASELTTMIAMPLAETEEELEAAEEIPKKKKKLFQLTSSPKCELCSNTVYKTEECLDSAEHVFHKLCLRCTTCKSNLNGKQMIVNESQERLLESQYRMHQDEGCLYCWRHGNIIRGSVIQGTLGGDHASSRIKDKEMLENNEIKEKREGIQKQMELQVGDVVPLCNRCGGSIESSGKIIVSGMERFHQVCPENTREAKLKPRILVKKAEGRPVVQIYNGASSLPISFLFELNATSKEAALLAKSKIIDLAFHLDTQAKGNTAKQLNTSTPKLRLQLRHDDQFVNVDPAGTEYAPIPDFIYWSTVLFSKKQYFMMMEKQGTLYFFKTNPGPNIDVTLASKKFHLDPKERSFEKVSGSKSFRVSVVDKHGKTAVIEIVTEFLFQIYNWENSICSIAGSDPEAMRITFRVFKLQHQVLQQVVCSFDLKQRTLTHLNEMVISYSAFPEIDENAKEDPLAQLKSDLKEKVDMVLKENELEKRAVIKKKKKSKCSIM